MLKTEVRKLDLLEYKMWDNLVEKSPQGTVFHTSDWLTICEKSLNKKLLIYGFFLNEKLVGGCSIFLYKISKIFTVASSSCSMTPYCGFIWETNPNSRVRKQERIQNDYILSFCENLEKQNIDFISLSNPPGFIDVRPFLWNSWNSIIKYTYYLELKDIILSTDARRNIKKARKNEIRIEKSYDIDLFYNLFEETFSRQGLTPPASKDFIKKIFNMLHKNSKGEMWFAKTKEGELAAAEIFCFDNKRPHRWTAATSTKLRNTGAYILLLDTVFNEFKERGYSEINLMAANTPQLSEFITIFNPNLIPYYVVEKKRIKYSAIKKITSFVRKKEV